MATMNPFDLLGDDDNDDPSLLIAKVEKEKPKVPATPAAAQAPQGKLVNKPLAPAQAVRESRNEGGRGGGNRGAGPRYARGGRSGGGGFNRESNNYEAGYGNSKPSEDGESGRTNERRSYGGPRIVGGGPSSRGRRGGYSNGEAGEGERPRRVFERRSGTGRGLERDKAVKGLVVETGGLLQMMLHRELLFCYCQEMYALFVCDGLIPFFVYFGIEEMTLEEYEKVLEEKRKALLALKTSEERKVDAKEFESMQQLSCKKENVEIFAKLGSDKDKKKETAAEREERVRRYVFCVLHLSHTLAVSINEFLKPAEGENPYRGGGRGRGRGRGDRGVDPAVDMEEATTAVDVSAPSIEDQGSSRRWVASEDFSARREVRWSRRGFGKFRGVLESYRLSELGCLAMEAALGLFTRIHCKDAASWNTTISGLAVVAWNAMMYGDADCGELDRAVKVFENVLVKSTVAYIDDTDNRGK
ncbi:unnamed protein product [Linum tenue]|uniref:STM1-like N-terminal domain-containing protein n=1 Tax=Linum tenue TaxID=586396 RepID=A0AAV0Q4V0_9ROSI|nr:unnamed protein product [Linum tenue]